MLYQAGPSSLSSWLCHSSVVQLYYLLRLWLCVLRLLGSLRTSKPCLRHGRLLKRSKNVQSWQIFTSIKTLLPSHRSLRSLKLPPQLMFWFSNKQRSVAFAFPVSFTSVTEWCGSQRTKSRGTSFLPCPFFYSALRASAALRATAFGHSSGHVPCASEDMVCGYWFSKVDGRHWR